MKNVNYENKETAICSVTPLKSLPGKSIRDIGYCNLLNKSFMGDALSAFRSAPHFKNADPGQLLIKNGRKARTILVGADDYYLRQAAVYLTSFASYGFENEVNNEFDDLDDFTLDLKELEDVSEEGVFNNVPQNSLLVVAAKLVDSKLDAEQEESPMRRMSGDCELTDFNFNGILIRSESGQVLTEKITEAIGRAVNSEKYINLFVALRPEQLDYALIEELRFSYGFDVVKIGKADNSYLESIMRKYIDDNNLSVDMTMDFRSVINSLRKYRGKRFEEPDVIRLLRNSTDMEVSSWKSGETGAYDKLNEMVGLFNVKDSLEHILSNIVYDSKRMSDGKSFEPLPRHMAFAGNPGTGKSVTARLVAEILREEGVGSGKFVEAGREQLIGSYLGQTSPKIAKLFEEAAGGVIFIDEAGALVNQGHEDIYCTEAVNALVRHMEIHPETMVIFATYPKEMDMLLKSNPGLSSRVSQVLNFTDYNIEELWEIFRTMCRKNSIKTTGGCKQIVCDYLKKLKAQDENSFGNGRDVRKLFQKAKEEMVFRTRNDIVLCETISAADIKIAIEKLTGVHQGSERKPVGFQL